MCDAESIGACSREVYWTETNTIDFSFQIRTDADSFMVPVFCVGAEAVSPVSLSGALVAMLQHRRVPAMMRLDASELRGPLARFDLQVRLLTGSKN